MGRTGTRRGVWEKDLVGHRPNRGGWTGWVGSKVGQRRVPEPREVERKRGEGTVDTGEIRLDVWGLNGKSVVVSFGGRGG